MAGLSSVPKAGHWLAGTCPRATAAGQASRARLKASMPSKACKWPCSIWRCCCCCTPRSHSVHGMPADACADHGRYLTKEVPHAHDQIFDWMQRCNRGHNCSLLQLTTCAHPAWMSGDHGHCRCRPLGHKAVQCMSTTCT